MAHHTFDPALPVYRGVGLREAYREGKVATRSELKRRRLQLAEGQQPIGQYWTAYEWAQLYRVADCVPMPALSPGRQRLWDTARTCARCGARSADPFERDRRGGRRVCSDCRPVEHEVHWYRVRNQDRVLAVWCARQLLDEPNVVLWASDDGPPAGSCYRWLIAAAAVDVGGQVLFAGEARVNEPVPAWAPIPDGWQGRGRPLADHADGLKPLADKLLVSWGWSHPGSFPERARDDLGIAIRPGRVVVFEAPGLTVLAQVGELARLWLGRPNRDRSICPHVYLWVEPGDVVAPPAPQPADLELPSEAARCVARARHLLDALQVIAGGEHPDGPAVCPHRDGRDGDTCGRVDVLTTSGMCPSHEPLYPQPSPTPGGPA